MDSDQALTSTQAQWDALAQKDPLWAVLTDPAKEGRNWAREEFFASGRREIASILGRLEQLGRLPDFTGEALDFGCGVGRLSAALTEHFAAVRGVDISQRMIDLARRMAPGVTYHQNTNPHLRLFADGQFTFIYSNIALQHIPLTAARAYVSEFVRLLQPDGVCVFHMPDERKPERLMTNLKRSRNWLKAKVALRTRLRDRRLRIPPASHADKSMEMNAISADEMTQLISSAYGSIVDLVWTNAAEPAFNGNLEFYARRASHGWSSLQYTVVRADRRNQS